MLTNTISLYKRVNQIKSEDEIPLDLFLDGIRDGKWQDEVQTVRLSVEKLESKKKVTSVTISGKFEERYDDKLVRHSGYIGIDIDKPDDINATKETLMRDPYVVSCFVSIGGFGLCVIFKINPEKHKESFKGICEYLYNTYEIVTDSTSINPSRARFVSFDPYIYINEKAQKFTQFAKEKELPPPPKVVYTGDDFSYILKQIVEGGLDVTAGSYYNWLRIGFGLADKFGEGGRDYFHTISSMNAKYNVKVCNRQFDACIKGGASVKKKTTISTFYYYCKEAGVDIYTPTTRMVIRAATSGKRAGLTLEQVRKNLKKFEDVDVTEEALKEAEDVKLDDETLLVELEHWVRQLYSLRRNVITRYVENYGKPMDKVALNSIYIKAKKVFEKLPFDLIERLIYSDFIPDYNPFLEFFEQHKDDDIQTGLIDKMFDCIPGDDPEKKRYFGKKWVVGLISSVYGEHSVLFLALLGEKQNTGKTEWFRRFLPKELKKYYAESKLDRDKDDEIMMTQKLIIMDDEMGGKSKKQNEKLKDLTSKEIFTLREPYGHFNVDLVRLAMLGGTGNNKGVLSDWSGNRRIIAMYVEETLDFKMYNEVDKVAMLMEAWHLYNSGFNWRLTNDDINYLKEGSVQFEEENLEMELLTKYFEPGKENMTAGEIKVYLEMKTNQRLSLNKLSQELKRCGFTQRHVKSGFTTKRYYGVRHLEMIGGAMEVPPPLDPAPF